MHTFWKPKACERSLKTRPKRCCHREEGFENPAPSIEALCVSKCLALSEGLMREQTDVSLRCHHWQCVASCKDCIIPLAQQRFRCLKAGFQQDTTDSKHSTSVNPSNNSTCNSSCWGLACILAWREAACTCQIFSGLRLSYGFFTVNWSRNKNQELRNTKQIAVTKL